MQNYNGMTITDQIVHQINEINPVQGKKLSKHIASCDSLFFERANTFFYRYLKLLAHLDKDLSYGIACYNYMIAEMAVERIDFLRTGTYSNSSFDDVNAKLYSNPETFDHHMHGLFLAQFLWWDQYIRFDFFSSNIRKIKPQINHYLEIGGGHGLYIWEATNLYASSCRYTVVDISPVSLDMCKVVVENPDVSYQLQNIFDYNPDFHFDFITIGEVIEHLEDPKAMLERLYDLLNEDGVIYLTTPVNAPMIDHIYLFNNIDEIRSLIVSCNFEIIQDCYANAEQLSDEKAKKYKTPIMYASFIKKK